MSLITYNLTQSQSDVNTGNSVIKWIGYWCMVLARNKFLQNNHVIYDVITWDTIITPTERIVNVKILKLWMVNKCHDLFHLALKRYFI